MPMPTWVGACGHRHVGGCPCPRVLGGCRAEPRAHLEGLLGAGVVLVPPLPGPLGLGEAAALQAGAEDVDVEEGVVAAGQPLAPRLQHQLPQRLRGAADVDDCAGRDGSWHPETPRSPRDPKTQRPGGAPVKA